MKYILDANTILYLTKLNLHEFFLQLLKNNEIRIDTSVYKETVEDGMRYKYPDGILIKNWLEKYQIPIIPVDISEMIPLYRDPGETSCAILVSRDTEDSICVTSDNKTIDKFEKNAIPYTQIDTFFYGMVLEEKINSKTFFDILYQLESIFAIKSERVLYFHELLQNEKPIQNDNNE
ncbi:MAG: hypothetical protein JW776_09180 [Candidatus Lokiarchaeota archaeon]|nr:hypothetical protein [Candidatus Lokiarchaeota archaeon]